MYMNALKFAVTPLVFFSIVNCLTQFASLSEVGRIGGRIMLSFLTMTFIAASLGAGIFFMFRSGSSISFSASSAVIPSAVSQSDMITGIIPSNFVRPFLEMNLVQVIFLAFMCGAAALTLGDYAKPLTELFDSCSRLFMAMIRMIIRLIPFAVLCSI